MPFRDELPPDTVRVRVVTPNAEPIEGASISCGYRVSVKSDADGRATCEVREDDAAWPLVVRAVKDERSGMTRTDGKEEAVVTLQPRGVLRGRVDGAIPPGSWTIALRSAQVTMSLPLKGTTFTREGHEAVSTVV